MRQPRVRTARPRNRHTTSTTGLEDQHSLVPFTLRYCRKRTCRCTHKTGNLPCKPLPPRPDHQDLAPDTGTSPATATLETGAPTLESFVYLPDPSAWGGLGGYTCTLVRFLQQIPLRCTPEQNCRPMPMRPRPTHIPPPSTRMYPPHPATRRDEAHH